MARSYSRAYRLAFDLASHSIRAYNPISRWSRGGTTVSVPFLERAEPWSSERYEARIDWGEWNMLHLDVEGSSLVRINGEVAGGTDYYIKSVPVEAGEGDSIVVELMAGGGEPWTPLTYRGIVDSSLALVDFEALGLALALLDVLEASRSLDPRLSSRVVGALLESLRPVEEYRPPRYWQMGLAYKVIHGARSTSRKRDSPEPRWDYGFAARSALHAPHEGPALDEGELEALVRDVESRLREAMGDLRIVHTKVYALAHSHIDVSWLWPFPATRFKVNRTFANTLAAVRAAGGLSAGQDSAQNYSLLERGLLERVRKLVSEGSFMVLGGSWVEPDTWSVTGESLARQFLHGQRFLEERVGRRARIGMLLDTFGLSPQLPQILRASGVEAVITHKMTWNDTNEFPLSSFSWRGLDGSRIPVYVAPRYDSGMRMSEVLEAESFRKGGSPVIILYGYGDGGGGASILMALRVKALNKLGVVRVETRFSEEELVRAIGEGLEGEWAGEIYNEYHRGVYSSDPRVKSLYSRLESCLIKLDYWTSLSIMLGLSPRVDTRGLWEVLLRSAFHDTVTGSSIREASEYSRRELEGALYKCNVGLLGALNSVAELLGAPRGLVAFNSLGWTRRVNGFPVPGHGYSIIPSRGAEPVVHEERGGRYRLLAGGVEAVIGPGCRLELLSYEGLSLASLGGELGVHPNRPGEFDAWEIEASSIGRGVPMKPASLGVEGSRLACKYVFADSEIIVSYTPDPDLGGLRVAFDVDWRDHGYMVKAWLTLGESHTALFEVPFGHVERAIDEASVYYGGRFEYPYLRWMVYPSRPLGLAIISPERHGATVVSGRIGLTVHLAPVFPNPENGVGRFHYEYLLKPYKGDLLGVVRAAYEEHLKADTIFVARDGEGRERASLMRQEGEALVESLKPSWDGDGIILRVYDPTGRGSRLLLKLPVKVEVRESNIVEDKLARLDDSTDAIKLELRPFEVRTLYLRPVA